MFHIPCSMKDKGFTLLEVMAAVFVITVGVIGALSALQRATSATFASSSRLEAIYLAQEGIEIVRNIRDTNWLKGDVWDSDLPISPPDYRVDYRTMALPDLGCGGIYLKIDEGFYKCSPDPGLKKLQRRITLSDKVDLDGDGEPDKMSVNVTVEWEERGEDFQVRVQENLYNWK